MRKWLLRTLILSTLVIALVVGPATPVAAAHSDLSAVRKATAKFHSTHAAITAGYVQFLPCFEKPGVGGMGQHFVHFPLDGTVDALHPEALVYEVDEDGRLELVAVEYIVPDTFARPTLFGQLFHHNTDLHLWALHAWIWRHNPLGTFADYNPNVALCPGHED